jgi:hypothetical protein
MASPPPGMAVRGPRAIGDRANAHDHHGPGAGLGHAACDEFRDIAEEARAVGYFALGALGAGQVSESRKLTIIAELQRLTAQPASPGIVRLYPFRDRLEHRFVKFRRDLQDW